MTELAVISEIGSDVNREMAQSTEQVNDPKSPDISAVQQGCWLSRDELSQMTKSSKRTTTYQQATV